MSLAVSMFTPKLRVQSFAHSFLSNSCIVIYEIMHFSLSQYCYSTAVPSASTIIFCLVFLHILHHQSQYYLSKKFVTQIQRLKLIPAMERTTNELCSLQFEIIILQAEHLQTAPFILHQFLNSFRTNQIIPQTQFSDLLCHFCKAGFEIHYSLIANIPATDIKDSLHLFNPTINYLSYFGSDQYPSIELISSQGMHSDHVIVFIFPLVEDRGTALTWTRIDPIVYKCK